MFPPHLPPPTCNVARHKQWQRMKILLAATVMGLAAGISGASIMLGWLWPGYGGGNVWFGSYPRGAASRGELEGKVREEMRQRAVTVYRGAANNRGVSFFQRQNRVGEAIIISSDGWIAMYFPKFDGKFKNLSVLTQDGKTYSLEKGLIDGFSGIAYLKISGGQFRAAAFADDIEPNDEVFALQNNGWQFETVRYPVYGAYGVPHLDSAPSIAYEITGSNAPASVVISADGRVAGLTKERNQMIPSSVITRVIPAVLGRGKIVYRALGAEGWFSEEQPIIVNSQRIGGFYVSKTPGASNPLKPGDVILQVNGKVARAGDLWYNEVERVNLRILREDKEIEIIGRLISNI